MLLSSMDDKQKSIIQENLVSLYLRLNGFFVNKFIVHSAKHGNNKSEIDCLAVRFPYNSEPEREIQTDPSIKCSNAHIDFLICEVKSDRQKIAFNKSLVNDGVLETILRWCGPLPEEKLQKASEDFKQAIEGWKNAKNCHEEPPTYVHENYRFRAIFFKPETKRSRENQPWFINEESIFSFISKCVDPAEHRDQCTTVYDLQAWAEFEKIIRYFKDADTRTDRNMQSLYKHLENTETN
ncbi:hypothetical protein [uncultured Cohaesibacter sp.]|uniref:hypothetical protein n=1 Tax=uncultured Cohaesibacter sp. TaxID=1002546 RepID=UPI002AABC26D|nr:hypothetical protein [uncultured Cohaesibacter sp.]